MPAQILAIYFATTARHRLLARLSRRAALLLPIVVNIRSSSSALSPRHHIIRVKFPAPEVAARCSIVCVILSAAGRLAPKSETDTAT